MSDTAPDSEPEVVPAVEPEAATAVVPDVAPDTANATVAPKKHGTTGLLVLAAAMLFAAAVLAVMAFQQPLVIHVDNRQESVKPGSTVSTLIASHIIDSQRGRLISVNGTVLEAQGGGAPRVWRNGQLVTSTARLFDGDKIVSAPGVDRVEATITVREPIPFHTRESGSGPVMHLSSPGAVGIRERVIGAVSRSVVTSRTVRSEQDMVIRRENPSPKDKLIALTFDDGPWPGQTEKILKILKQEGIHATFFELGVRIKAAPQLSREVAADGNLIGDHTLGHRDLTKQKPKEITRQIVGGLNWIKKATGINATWFRPPYGAINSKVWAETRSLHLHVALWDIDTRDWARPGVKKIVNNVNKHAHSGAIVLMHDGGGNRDQTIAALPTIIHNLKKRGYVFVTLQELDAAK